MKILANPDLVLNSHRLIQTLPHLAIEFFDVKDSDKLISNDILFFQTPYFDFKAVVFKPGDGTRFILKSFVISVDTEIKKPNLFFRLLKVFKFKYEVKPHGKLLLDLTNFIYGIEGNLLHHAQVLKPIE